jgi:hypothetical protein
MSGLGTGVVVGVAEGGGIGVAVADTGGDVEVVTGVAVVEGVAGCPRKEASETINNSAPSRASTLASMLADRRDMRAIVAQRNEVPL